MRAELEAGDWRALVESETRGWRTLVQRVAQSVCVCVLTEAEVVEGRRKCWAYGMTLEEFEAGQRSGCGTGARCCSGTLRVRNNLATNEVESKIFLTCLMRLRRSCAKTRAPATHTSGTQHRKTPRNSTVQKP